jgi:hypothetical protein
MSGQPLMFTESFVGVAPSGTYIQMPETTFKGKIVDIEVADGKNDPGSKVAAFTVAVSDPSEYVGARRTFRLRIPDASEKGQNSKAMWRALLESLGYTPAQLDTGAITVTNEAILNREGHFYHVPRKAGVKDSYDEITVLTPTVYAQRKRAGVPQQAAQTVAATATGPANGAVAASVAAPLDPAQLKATLLS